MKTAIVIITYNVANLILRQIDCTKRFCKDGNYDIIVVDNSTDKSIIDAIQYSIRDTGVIYFKTYSADAYGSRSHAFACNMAYMRFKEKYDMFFFMDHDLFPIREFSIADILKDKAMAGLGQSKSKDYFWPGCVMWNNKVVDNTIIDFSTNNELGLDTGGNLYLVIEKYGKEACLFFDEKYYENPHFKKTMYNFYATINDDMFMHFINSSGWNKIEGNEERINSLINILEERTANG